MHDTYEPIEITTPAQGLEAAAVCLYAAELGIDGDGNMYGLSEREFWRTMSDSYCLLAQTLQAEREFEERQLQKIREQHT